jgi:hypothetical protein
MHYVTSAIFLPILMKYLSPSSKEIFLRSWVHTVLVWHISRGCAKLDVCAFFARPLPEYASTIPAETPYSVVPKSAVTPNPWSHILDSTIVHADQHLSKIVRALLHFSSLYGSTRAEDTGFKNTELEGADVIDGTLFLRAAALSLEREIVPTEDGTVRNWDRDGFFNK